MNTGTAIALTLGSFFASENRSAGIPSIPRMSDTPPFLSWVYRTLRVRGELEADSGPDRDRNRDGLVGLQCDMVSGNPLHDFEGAGADQVSLVLNSSLLTSGLLDRMCSGVMYMSERRSPGWET